MEIEFAETRSVCGWVHDQNNLFRIPTLIPQILHEACPVAAPAPVGDLDLAPATKRLESHEQVGGAVADMLAVCPGREDREGRTLPISCLLHSSKQTTDRCGSTGRQHISSTSSTRQTNSADCFGGNAPHSVQMRLERILPPALGTPSRGSGQTQSPGPPCARPKAAASSASCPQADRSRQARSAALPATRPACARDARTRLRQQRGFQPLPYKALAHLLHRARA